MRTCERAKAQGERQMSSDVRSFYDGSPDREWGRLDLPLCRVEMASTLRLVDAWFPPGGHVLDIGAGPGRYAIELARRGFRVTLSDLSSALMDRARRAFADEGLEAGGFVEADARDLSAFPDESADAALFLGPLYHLGEGDERRVALAELRRVLKPGGVAIAAYLNSWGLMRTGLSDFPSWYRDPAVLRGMLEPRSFTAAELRGFTAAHWSTPPAALAELRAAGFEVPTYAGAEGFCGGMWPVVDQLAKADPAAFENVLALAAETSELPQFRDATDHVHFVLRKIDVPPSAESG